MEYPDWLNGLITTIATVSIAVTTFYYARVTKKILDQNRQMRIDALNENRQMRIDAQKPQIIIYPRVEKEQIHPNRPKNNAINLYVENIGMGPALHVQFDVNLSFPLSDKRTLQEVGFLEHSIHYLPPGHVRKHRLNHDWGDGFEALMKERLVIKVDYKDSRDEPYKERFHLDFREHSAQR